MKRILFAMVLGILVFLGNSFNAHAHERGPLSGHQGVAWVVGGGGSLFSQLIFSPHNPRILVAPGGIYFLGGHHIGSPFSTFKERLHGPRFGIDTHVSFPSHHKRRSHILFDRGHHDHEKRHQRSQRHSRHTRDHHYR